jgi:hypothetical protein
MGAGAPKLRMRLTMPPVEKKAWCRGARRAGPRARARGGHVAHGALPRGHEVHLEVARVGARVGGEEGGAARREAAVVDHHVRWGRALVAERAADGRFDARADLLGALDARADGGR